LLLLLEFVIDKLCKRVDVAVNADSCQRIQIGIAVIDPDDGPGLTVGSEHCIHQQPT